MHNKRTPSLHDENDPFTAIYTPHKPPSKRPRRSGLPNTADPALQEEWRKAQEERVEREKDERARTQATAEEQVVFQLRAKLSSLREDGYTLHAFLFDLFNTKDPHISSQITKLVDNHGLKLFEAMERRSPYVALEWFNQTMDSVISKEAKRLAQQLRPGENTPLSATLVDWRLDDVLAAAEDVAPTLVQILRLAATHDDQGEKRRDRNLILATVFCLIAQSYSERSNETQTVLGIYLFACGASRSQFAVLQHAGFTSSYTKALQDIRRLHNEQLTKVVHIAKSQPFMLVWDNLNFAFKVNEQRLHRKDHFDNGTTATLVPLFGVEPGVLPLSLLHPRSTRLHVIPTAPHDLLPSATCIEQLELAMLWHIEDILFDAYPTLRSRLSDIPVVPSVENIPLHKTEQYPLPAVAIDESSIDGTLDVLEYYIQKTLHMSEQDVKDHGIILCGGDQLSNSLCDKASACRRDDTHILDNPSLYGKPQLGLFHVKMAAMRAFLNEHWGKPNSKAPWSLWRMNTLLGRKPISAGWKAKKLAPFRPAHELMIKLTLPANILDAFRLCCPHSTPAAQSSDHLDKWVSSISTHADIRVVSIAVRDRLCSAQRVSHLRDSPDGFRDHTLENIILFNRDALILREFIHSIKRGDIGSVINVLSYWTHEFRGTGSMTKYSDALFEVLADLKSMDPRLQHAFKMNWLVNLTGQPNSFKETDLMQEHQNFWAKASRIIQASLVIYIPQGSNRSWKFLGTVSVLIFVLRDVIRNVQSSFKTPHNGKSHSSPTTTEEIFKLREYLRTNRIQSYHLDRDGGDAAILARDIFTEGVKYCHTASAFKNFRANISKATYRDLAQRASPENTNQTPAATSESTRSKSANHLDSDAELEDSEDDRDVEKPDEDDVELDDIQLDDVLDDSEEFSSDIADTIEQIKELVNVVLYS